MGNVGNVISFLGVAGTYSVCDIHSFGSNHDCNSEVHILHTKHTHTHTHTHPTHRDMNTRSHLKFCMILYYTIQYPYIAPMQLRYLMIRQGTITLILDDSWSVLSFIRSVAEEQRCAAPGFQSVVFSLLGEIPGPLTLGAIFDSSCILWQY